MKHLFVVAHPDDEVLGAGAYIYGLAQSGDEAGVLVLNTYDTTRYKFDSEMLIEDMHRSHRIIGITHTWMRCYIDSNFHNADHRDMVMAIESAIRDFQPDFIYTQHPGDVNSDHFWTAQSCMEAFRLWQRGREKVKPIEAMYLMEVQSSTDWALNPALSRFVPNAYVEVTRAGLEAKVNALAVYENVIRPAPHPRSEEAIMAKAVTRGSEAGFAYAEAFECVFRRMSV